MLSRAEAHLWCGALVLADGGTRALRLWLLVRALGGRVTVATAAASNGVADLAAAVTPLRAGGLPAHAGVLVHSGLHPTTAVAALGVEALASYPVVALLGALLVARAGGTWWREAGPALGAALRGGAWPLALVALTGLGAWWMGRALRRRFRAVGEAGAGLRAALAHARRTPWALAAALPLTAVQVLARLAVLPVLTRTLPHPPRPAVAFVGAFGLLYSQLVLPTPSGAGAVELAGAAGAAGDLAGGAAWVLGWWRVYTALGVGAFGVPWLARAAPGLARAVRREATAGR